MVKGRIPGKVNRPEMYESMGMGRLAVVFQNFFRLMLISMFFAASLSGAESTAWAAPSGKIRIGLTLGLTGKYTEMSRMQKMGYTLWARQVNGRGGLLGREVELIIKDDGSEGERAAALYEEMIAREKVDLVFGPYSSGITMAVLPVTARHDYPMLVGGASSDRIWEQGYDSVFGVYTPAGRYTVGFLEMLATHHIDGIAVISADDAFSLSIAAGTRKWADRYGLNTVFSGSLAKGSGDLGKIIARGRQSGAKVLIICGHFNEAVEARKALDRLGWVPTAFYASVGPVLRSYRQLLGEKSDEPQPDLSFPGSREFLSAFREAFGLTPSYHAATAFASGIILEDAVRNAGSVDRRRLKDALGKMDTMSLIGRYGVDRTGMQIRQFPVIVQWQDGEKAIVWPGELQTAIPVVHGEGRVTTPRQ